eukprot:1278352-Rhodomonas_salina.1
MTGFSVSRSSSPALPLPLFLPPGPPSFSLSRSLSFSLVSPFYLFPAGAGQEGDQEGSHGEACDQDREPL